MSFRKNLEKMAAIYEGIAIFSVDKGSTTHRAGVRAGDVLVAVNGRRVRRLAEYATARRLRDELIELVVVRDGRELRLWGGRYNEASANEGPGSRPPPPSHPRENENLTCGWRGAA